MDSQWNCVHGTEGIIIVCQSHLDDVVDEAICFATRSEWDVNIDGPSLLEIFCSTEKLW